MTSSYANQTAPTPPPPAPAPNWGGGRAPTYSERGGPITFLRQRAAWWWVPTLIPVFGTLIAWLWASFGARRFRYGWMAVGWLFFNVGASASPKASQDGAYLVFLWLLGIVLAWRKRHVIRMEIEAHF